MIISPNYKSIDEIHTFADIIDKLPFSDRVAILSVVESYRLILPAGFWANVFNFIIRPESDGGRRLNAFYMHKYGRKTFDSAWKNFIEHMKFGKDEYDKMSAGGYC